MSWTTRLSTALAVPRSRFGFTRTETARFLPWPIKDRVSRLNIASESSTASFAATAQDIPAEYQQVLTALGKQGDYKANVLKVNIPRNDVSVTVANVKTPTPFGFGGWIAMTKGTGGMDVMMGDLVLTQDEVNPV